MHSILDVYCFPFPASSIPAVWGHGMQGRLAEVQGPNAKKWHQEGDFTTSDWSIRSSSSINQNSVLSQSPHGHTGA